MIIVHFVGVLPFNVVVSAFPSLSESIAHVVVLIEVSYFCWPNFFVFHERAMGIENCIYFHKSGLSKA